MDESCEISGFFGVLFSTGGGLGELVSNGAGPNKGPQVTTSLGG